MSDRDRRRDAPLDEDQDDFEYVPVPPKIAFTTWITFIHEGRGKPAPFVFDDDDDE